MLYLCPGRAGERGSWAKASDLLRRFRVTVLTTGAFKRQRKQTAATGDGFSVPEEDLAADTAAFVMIDNADLDQSTYGRNRYDRVKKGLHFVFVAAAFVRGLVWPPPPPPQVHAAPPPPPPPPSAPSAPPPRKAAKSDSETAASASATGTGDSTTGPPSRPARSRTNAGAAPAAPPALETIDPGVGAPGTVPREVLLALQKILKNDDAAKTLFGLHGIKGLAAELSAKIAEATSLGEVTVDAADLNEWMAAIRTATKPKDVNVTVLEPVNMPASSDEGIVAALLRVADKLRVRNADGSLRRYVVVIVDQAIYVRVWRIMKKNKNTFAWVLPFPGERIRLAQRCPATHPNHLTLRARCGDVTSHGVFRRRTLPP